MTLITGNVNDVANRPDDTPWVFWSVTLRNDDEDNIITTRRRPVTPVGGQLSVKLEPGNVAVQMPNGDIVYCAVPDQAEYGLWDLIEEAVPYPVGTSQELLLAAVTEALGDPSEVGPLTRTFVRFVDQNSDPLPPGSLTTIHVNTETGEIDDITFEGA